MINLYFTHFYALLQTALLGGNGVEKVIEFDLNAEEQALLDNSVKAVKELVADMERLGF